jgi:hypothetical protein
VAAGIFNLAHQFQSGRRHKRIANVIFGNQVEGFFPVKFFSAVRQNGNTMLPAGKEHINQAADPGPIRRRPEEIFWENKSIYLPVYIFS